MEHDPTCNRSEKIMEQYDDYYDNVLVKEQPFYRTGMTAEEVTKEREYLNENLQRFYEGEYTPLWRQDYLK